MTENEPTDEHDRPGENDGDAEPKTEVGRPRPSTEVPAYPRPQVVPDPPPAPPPPQAAPPPPPQPYPTAPPPQPYAAPYQYPPQPQYQPPAPPPPQETVHGGSGTLWLRPESGVTPAPPPAPPGGAYLGAPIPTPYPPGYPMAPAVPAEPGNGKAVAAMVLGIVGLILLLSSLGLFFFINLPCSVLAWIFGVQGKRAVDRGETTKGDGMAKAGIWMGVIGTILGVLAIIGWVLVIALTS